VNHFKHRLRNWTIRHAESPHAKRWLSFFSFAEAFFFPVPPDVILLAVLATKERLKWKQYAAITTIFSVFGGVFGYIIGLFLFDSIGVFLIEIYNLQEHVKTVGSAFVDNAFIAMFLAGFTLIPYKVFTISAGFFEISFLTFVIASVLSRAARFFLVAYVMYIFGDKVGMFVFKYFNIATLILATLIVGVVVWLYII